MVSNLIGGFFFTLMVLCPIFIGTGYFMLIRQVWHLPDRKARVKQILLTKETKSVESNPKAALVIGLGALCGVVSCLGMLVWVFLVARR